MIQIKLNWPLGAFEKQITLLNQAILNNTDAAIKDAAFIIQGYARRNIQGGARSGKTYKVGGKTSVRSAPYEWPKTDTGRLVSSIRVNFPTFLTADVGSDVEYSQFLETGTKKMLPRPWLQRSVDENADTLNRMLSNALEQAIK